MENITPALIADLTDNGKVVLEFYGNGCLNCQMMQPILTDLEQTFPDVRFYCLNADRYTAIAQHYQISSLPTLLLIRHGKILSKIVGVKTATYLRSQIDQILNYA